MGTHRPPYLDEKVFRYGNGSEVIEVLAPSRPDSGFVFSMDSFDAPEIGLRVPSEVVKALIEWLSADRETQR